MSLHTRTRAIVVGAGIGGLATAVALRRVGVEVEVYERASELRPAGFGISVVSNAVSALRVLGIDLGLEKRGQTIVHTEIMTGDGRTLRSLPIESEGDRLGAPSVAMARGDLHAALLDGLGDQVVRTGAVATGYERTASGGVRVRFEDGREATGDILIGADGINSVVRRQRTGDGRPRYGGFLCWLAVTPYEHPRMTTGFNGHYWGVGKRFGIHDVGHGRAYWWGTINMPVHAARAWNGDKDQIVRAYAGWADEVRHAVRTTPVEDIVAVPALDRPFLEQWGDGPVTLLGDAAHPMLPSLGQGGSTAIEDAVVLAQCLASHSDPVAALRAYENTRRERTRFMVETSAKFAGFEQVENPVLCAVRDAYLRRAPQSVLFAPFQRALTPQLLGS
ncbi:FAD-dependent urate hydroxylase [Streptomyces netropsis]|uniref:2-polyprenyl-6-methoxyphenol hydroxylase-like FAD-dependent oxidoreductase n=1 Tax=Streptomyces syringium TaxID=76729 RepID=A0ABS4YEJ5_9ACTN|nr:FAD-dependent monooxygenase [Streptomyces syringium]MBP2407070.1 2-polyprenyl-6-methoxyphenol hydroxylase-like FAD-dependent oxidoreductase [Streptomyces syringium]SPE62190.1 FAD-dependent urate hydroxylase [Streptomyces netropsis]